MFGLPRRPARPPQPGSQEDAAWLKRAGAGDKEAFHLLVEKYKQRAFAVANNVVRSSEDAEDIVQESFVKAWLSLAEFRGESSFYTWLYRIVYNMALDYKRKVTRRRETFEPAEQTGGGDGKTSGLRLVEGRDERPGPEGELLQRETAGRLLSLLDELTEDHRSVVMLREVDGLSYDEIAEVLGVSKGTVMSRLFYARKKLQKGLGDLKPDAWGSGEQKSVEEDELFQASGVKEAAHEKK